MSNLTEFNFSREIRNNERHKTLFFEFIKNNLSEHTQKAYIADMNKFLNFLALKKYSLDHRFFNPTTIPDFRDYLLLMGQKHSTVKRALTTLKVFFDFLIEKKKINFNPVKGVKRPTVKLEVQTDELNDEEVNLLFDSFDLNSESPKFLSEIRNYALIKLMFMTGLRVSEAITIRVGQFIKIRDRHYLNLLVKGGHFRRVPVPKAAIEAIEEYKNAFYRIKGDVLNKDGFLFIKSRATNNDHPINRSTVNKLFQRKGLELGFITENRNFTPHSARATVAGNLYKNNVTLVKSADLLGHADPRMTLAYIKRREGYLEEASDAISYS
jgi:site-specific recombinase XerD